MYLFLAHMDTGSACSRFNIYGQKGLFGYVTLWTMATASSQVITGIVFSDMDAYYLLEMKSYTHQVDFISTGRYYGDVDVILWNSHSQLATYKPYHRTISSSDVAISSVCKYSGTRFAPINVPNHASSVCITIFFL